MSSQRQVASAPRPALLDDLLNGMGLIRKPAGFPRDGRLYVGRDNQSVWLWEGEPPSSAGLDVFDFLERAKEVEALAYNGPANHAITYDPSLIPGELLDARLADLMVRAFVRKRIMHSGRECHELELTGLTPPKPAAE